MEVGQGSQAWQDAISQLVPTGQQAAQSPEALWRKRHLPQAVACIHDQDSVSIWRHKQAMSLKEVE